MGKVTFAQWKAMKDLPQDQLDKRWHGAIEKFKNLKANFDEMIKIKLEQDPTSVRKVEKEKGLFFEVSAEIDGFEAYLEVHKFKNGNVVARYMMFDPHGKRSVIRNLSDL